MDNIPQRGQIWQVTFEPTVGAEITKSRPAIVVNIPEAGRLPLCIVIPITDWKPSFSRFFWFVPLPPTKENGLSKESGADCFQVKSLSIQRFIRKLGNVTEEQLENIVCAIALCIGYTAESQHD
jgi:mRNA interferase MazF